MKLKLGVVTVQCEEKLSGNKRRRKLEWVSRENNSTFLDVFQRGINLSLDSYSDILLL